MRLLITVLAALLGAIALGWLLQQSSGEVLFSYKEWIVQTSLVVFVVAAVIIFLLAYCLFRLLGKLLRLPSDWRRRSERGRRGLLSATETKAGQLLAYAGALQQAGNEQDGEALMNAWRKIPRKLKKESSLLGAYVAERLRQGDSSDCEVLLRRALKRQYDPELTRLFGLVEGRNLKRQLEFAEDCLSRYPQDAALLLTLGRLCKKNRLWGKAKSYLEQSIQTRPAPETYRELAILLEQQGESDAARTCLQEGLNLAADTRTTPGSLV